MKSQRGKRKKIKVLRSIRRGGGKKKKKSPQSTKTKKPAWRKKEEKRRGGRSALKKYFPAGDLDEKPTRKEKGLARGKKKERKRRKPFT